MTQFWRVFGPQDLEPELHRSCQGTVVVQAALTDAECECGSSVSLGGSTPRVRGCSGAHRRALYLIDVVAVGPPKFGFPNYPNI
jgi:hypothetical protein